jgi:hypothetical protein
MSTTLVSPPTTTGRHTGTTRRRSPVRRFFGVVTRPQSYRSILYLLLGLPLGMWYVIRAFANVERRVADVLLDEDITPAPITSGFHGNLWTRLKVMSADRARWRELGYLILRFPAGVATFVVAVTALTVPAVLAYAPIHARYVDDSFGNWFWSSELEHFAARSPWSWGLVPLGLVMLLGAFHLMNGLAKACGRWTANQLGRRAG